MSDTVNLIIDGKAITAQKNDTILLAAEKNGIEIPNLCYLKEMSPYGACGMCVVEAEGSPKLMRACSQKVSEGMVINTMGERALKARKIALDHAGVSAGIHK